MVGRCLHAMLYSRRNSRFRNKHQPHLQHRGMYRATWNLYRHALTYSAQVVGFLSAAIVMTTSTVNQLIYSPNGAMEAAAAGHILLSIVTVCLLSRVGISPLTKHRLSGCFTLVPLLQPPIECSSTNLPSTRRVVNSAVQPKA